MWAETYSRLSRSFDLMCYFLIVEPVLDFCEVWKCLTLRCSQHQTKTIEAKLDDKQKHALTKNQQKCVEVKQFTADKHVLLDFWLYQRLLLTDVRTIFHHVDLEEGRKQHSFRGCGNPLTPPTSIVLFAELYRLDIHIVLKKPDRP